MSAPPHEPGLDPFVGRVLDGRYRIEAAIGSGGIGTVYRAVHLALDRPVAIKVLRPEFAKHSEFLARFDREARALSRLSHVNVVTVTDFGVADGFPYLVMELLSGRSLEEEIDRGNIPLPRAFVIGRQILATLVYAHAQGVVNRDLKPQNVILVDQPGMRDFVKVLDFGLAKIVGTDGQDDSGDRTLTQHGTVFGTPAYMSPEQAEGHPADARSDLYSAGILIYEMLAGRPPFLSENTAELMRHHVLTRPPRMGDVAAEGVVIPEMFERVVARALQKERGARYQTAGEMLGAFEEAGSVSGAVFLDERSTPRAAPTSDRVSAIARTLLAKPVGAVTRAVARRRRATIIGAAAALCALVLLVILLSGLGSSSPEASPPAPRPLRAAPLVKHVVRPAPRPVTPARPHARDPWEGENIPPQLVSALSLIDAGQLEAAERIARDWVKTHREDPRGQLVLAHDYCIRGWRRDGLRRYRMALRLDETVRGDPRVMVDLVTALGDPRVSADAASMIKVVFGPEAIPALVRGTTTERSLEAAHACARLLIELGQGARVDTIAMTLADLPRARTCEERVTALGMLRGARDARVRPALEALRTNLDVRECLGDELERAIAAAGARN